ncbi:MAG: response regulator transcription factor [Cyanobacteria bacterium]|nr:response regulator transcription factor [Cyanobacteriota bacterium]
MSAEPTSLAPLNIVIVDDHSVVRQGSRDLISTHAELNVIGEADSGENLLGLLKLKQPDVLLLDINLPGKNGLELLGEVRDAFPELRILLFSAHNDIQYIRKAIALKADGYISKTVSEDELQRLILLSRNKAALPIYSEDIALKLLDMKRGESENKLTAREEEILLYVAQGKTNKDIAESLIVSVKTIDSHVANLMKKLGVSNRAQLTAYAYEHGLL